MKTNLKSTLIKIVAALCVVACISSAHATLIAYEPFNYTSTIANNAASTANAATPAQTSSGGFTGNWTCSASATVAASGLTYTSLPVLNKAITTASATCRESLATPQSSGTIYIGFLFTANNNNNGGNRQGLMMVNSSGTGYMFNFHESTATAGIPSINAVTTFAVGASLGVSGSTRLYSAVNLYVVKLTYTSGNVSRIDVYTNPTANQNTAPAADFSITTGLGTSGALAILGHIGGTISYTSDEWRVGTTFGDAVGFVAAPSAPTGVTATAGTSQVVLNWTASAGATSYNVLRSTTTGTETSLATGVTGTTYPDSTAVNGIQYFYVVQAVSGGGTSGNSSEVNATPMAAPTGLGATPGANYVDLSWIAPSGGGQTSYNVKRSTANGGPYTTITTSGAQTTTSYHDSTAVGGMTYYYVVSAANVNGQSVIGESANSSQAGPATPTVAAPSVPTSLSATPSSGSVALSWTAGSGATSYNVKRSTTSGSGYATISTSGAVTGTGYTDSTAVNGTIYYYVVSSVNSVGESADSSQVTAAMPPAAPTSVGAAAGVNQVTVSWTASSGASGATGYNVKRSTTSGSGYTTLAVGANVSGSPFIDSTAISGTTYYYVVAGTNASGEGNNSSQSSATPTGAPQPPTGLTATAGSTSIALSWTAALGAPVSYNVKRSTTSGSGYVTLTTSGAQTTTSFTDTGTSPGTTYYYMISAVNTYGESANSSQASGAVSAAGATVYESFNYASIANGTGVTGTGESGTWTVGATAPTIATGLTYSGLPTANSAISSTGNRQSASFANSLSSGTKFISFLFKNSTGNAGDTRYGVYFPNGGTGLFFGYVGANSPTLGNLGLASMDTTGTAATGMIASLASSYLGTYGNTYFVVLKIDFDTSGANDTITVYINPTANSATPVVASTYTVSSFNVGTITGIGLNVQASTVTVDEIRVGNSYGAVAGLTGPAIPTGISATAGNNLVSLSWSAASGANSYTVLRSTASGVEQVLAAGVSGTSYTDSTAVNGTTYYYVVQAVNTLGGSAFSTEQNATPIPPPGQPQNLTAYPGVNSVGLSWTATSGATGYKVLRGTTSGTYTVTNNVTANTNYDVTTAGGTTYYYVVEATNTSGVGVNSSEVSALPTIALPTAPSGLAATPANSQVSLTWTVGVGAASYNVKRSATSGSGYITISTTGAVTGNNYTDSTAVNGDIYYYVVSSTNSAGESTNCTEAAAAMPPATPTGLGATPGANQVSLNWTASTGASGATSYNVKRSTTSGSGYSTISTPGAVTGTIYTDSTAISGTTYYYVVSGTNSSGEGNNSTQASATPSGVPQAPTGVTLTTNYTSLNLSWAAALGVPTGYNVKRSTSSGAETTLPAGTNVAGTTFTDTTVTPGVLYYYKISAVNGDGEGANSSEVSGAAPGLPSAYESFNYGSIANGTASTATGFSGTWTTTANPTIVAGLAYPNLPAANSAFKTTGGHQRVNLSTPLNGGTVWIGFLFQQNGDNGGNRAGFELLNGSGGGVLFAYHQSTGVAGTPSIDAVTGYTTVGSELGVSGTLRTYSDTNFYVMRLIYNGAGAVTNLAVYSNPPAGQGTAPAADFTITSGLSGIGTITALGMANAAGVNITVDEWRVGTTFAEAVGYSIPSAPAGVTATAGVNSVGLSWNVTSGATGYKVLRGTSTGVYTVTNNVASNTNFDATAVAGTPYFYVVEATNSVGVSANSTEVSATPLSPIVSTNTVTSSSNPSGNTTNVTFTSTITPGSPFIATGNVTFLTNGAVLSVNALNGSGVATSAATSLLPRGTNTITAEYAGDGNFIGSTNTLDQVVTNHPPVAVTNTFTRGAYTSIKIPKATLLANDTDVDGDTRVFDSYSANTTNTAPLSDDVTYIYVPTNNVNDAFQYTIHDNNGGTNTAWVYITITSSIGQEHPSVTPTPTNTTVTFYGIPGVSYQVQRDTNMDFVNPGVSNFPVMTPNPTNGAIVVTDDFNDLGGADTNGSAFYRLTVP